VGTAFRDIVVSDAFIELDRVVSNQFSTEILDVAKICPQVAHVFRHLGGHLFSSIIAQFYDIRGLVSRLTSLRFAFLAFQNRMLYISCLDGVYLPNDCGLVLSAIVRGLNKSLLSMLVLLE
jgi:hypothetical protein